MPPFLSSCKACIRLLSGKNCALQLKEGIGLGLLRRGESGIRLDRFSQSRVLSSRARTGGIDFGNSVSTTKEIEYNAGNLRRNSQIRRFLGCGDGDEGNVLSKTYEERRVMGYSPEQLFAVVEAVDCTRISCLGASAQKYSGDMRMDPLMQSWKLVLNFSLRVMSLI